MSDKIQKEYPHLVRTLLVVTCVLISVLCSPRRSYAETVRLFNVTFEGVGTYKSNHDDVATTGNFSFKTVYDMSTGGAVVLSEDGASSPDTWGNPIGMGSSVNVSGTFTTSNPGYGTCSGSFSTEDWAVYIYALKSLLVPESGYIFEVQSIPILTAQNGDSCGLAYGGETQGSVSDPFSFAAEFSLPPDALAQGKIIQYVSKNITTTGDGYTATIAWNGTVTFEKLAEIPGPSTPPPSASGYSFSFDPVDTPTFNFDPATSKPIGFGSVADGGDTLDLSVDFSYPSPVDLYLVLYAPSISQDFFLIGPGPSVQPLSQGIIKWKENISGPVEETVFGGIPIGALPDGTYSFYLLATPPNSTASYYLWETQFTK